MDSGALARGTARFTGIAWLLAAAWIAIHNASEPVDRDIGNGFVTGCGRVFASQIPQLLLGIGGGALLIVAAATHRPATRRVLLGAGALLAAWLLAATALPGAFAWTCDS
jgi:hypothetical protein